MRPILTAVVLSCVVSAISCSPRPADPPGAAGVTPIAAPPGTARPPFAFAAEDDRFLDEIQRGAFNFFWREFNPTGMAPDRTSAPMTVSTAGVGFQLSAFVIGSERGWVTKAAAQARTLRILRALDANAGNRFNGLFFHFIDAKTAGLRDDMPEDVVSTIDSALLFAGLLTAGQYFGGECQEIASRLFAQANWRSFVPGPDMTPTPKPWEKGFISLSWRPDSVKNPHGPGKLSQYYWLDNGDEHRLVTFLAVAAPNPEFAVDPAIYYRLRRPVGDFTSKNGQATGPMVFLPWSGAHFANIFAHCWINYGALGVDNPASFGVENRVAVDWWENSRRQTQLHRLKAMDATGTVPTLSAHAWGLTSSDAPTGYAVPGVYPTAIAIPGARPEFDLPAYTPKDDLGDGTIAPYGAVSSVLFDPKAALDAARYYRSIVRPDGSPLAWQDPSTGVVGFRDAFNLGSKWPGGWVAADDLAIDLGPMLVAIENARSGFVWQVFQKHSMVQSGYARLRWEERAERPEKK